MSERQDPFMTMLDVSMSHVGKWANLAGDFAYLLYRTMDGDDVQDEARELLRKHGYTDSETNEWLHDEVEEDEEE